MGVEKFGTWLADAITAVKNLGEEKAQYNQEKIVRDSEFGNFIIQGDKLALIRPERISLDSLSGLLDYWGVLKLKEEALFSVCPQRVSLLVSKANSSKFGELINYAEAVPLKADLSFIGNWMTQEDAIIRIRTSFKYDEEAYKVLSTLGTVIIEESITTDDDGVSQNIVAKSGIQAGEKSKLGTVTLKPYETFAEIQDEIPGRLYKVRIKKENGCAFIALHTCTDPSIDLAISRAIKKFLVAGLADRGISSEVAERMVLI